MRSGTFSNLKQISPNKSRISYFFVPSITSPESPSNISRISPPLSPVLSPKQSNIPPDQSIPQLDGLDSPPPSPSACTLPLQQSKQYHPISGQDPGVSTPRLQHAPKASFKLDKAKQVKRLKAHTTISDFEIDINTSGESINILCNTGFYSKAALPAMKRLSSGMKDVGEITITCHDITERSDALGASTTTIIIFRFSQGKESCGGVTVHLHHTTRNIQIQGSAMLPDNKKAPVWFVDMVVRDLFTKMSTELASDISNFNKTVGNLITEQLPNVNKPSICSGCKNSFNGRSAPEQCSKCKLFFHRFKCFPTSSHPCYAKKRPSSQSSLFVPNVSNEARRNSFNNIISQGSPSSVAQAQCVPPSRTANKTIVTNDNTNGTTTSMMIDTPASSIRTGQTHPRVSAHVGILPEPGQILQDAMSPVTTTWVVPSSPNNSSPTPFNDPESVYQARPSTSTNNLAQSLLDPNTPEFVSRNANPETGISGISGKDTSGNTGKVIKSKNKSSKGKQSNNSGESIELEYAKYETNVTLTKLKALETTNRDLKFRNSILESRVEELETRQKREIYDRYFPKTVPEESPQPQPRPHCNASSHLILSGCSCSTSGCTQKSGNNMQDTQSSLADIVKENVKQTNELKENVAALEKKLDNFTNSLHSKKSEVSTASLRNDLDNREEIEGEENAGNTSQNSIDEEIQDVSFDDLNSNALTTR